MKTISITILHSNSSVQQLIGQQSTMIIHGFGLLACVHFVSTFFVSGQIESFVRNQIFWSAQVPRQINHLKAISIFAMQHNFLKPKKIRKFLLTGVTIGRLDLLIESDCRQPRLLFTQPRSTNSGRIEATITTDLYDAFCTKKSMYNMNWQSIRTRAEWEGEKKRERESKKGDGRSKKSFSIQCSSVCNRE